MAESNAYTLASNVLSTITSPAFIAAYEKGLFFCEAKDELSKLQEIIESIQTVLQNQQDSNDTRAWIKRLKDVLYDADDLFEEVATRYLIQQQRRKGNYNIVLSKVFFSSSKFTPSISRSSIVKDVKKIRKSLVGISNDMPRVGFERHRNEVPVRSMRTGQDLDPCPEVVIGREVDKLAVLEMLFNESDIDEPIPSVIAIVGIVGIGKTTFAQLVYNDDEVKKKFSSRWFACISDRSSEKEILGKIFQAICAVDHTALSVSQLQTKIRILVTGQKFLLVLDDVWEDHRSLWHNLLGLLTSCVRGSRIILTTRLQSVAIAANAIRTHNLEGLSDEDSWYLFKRLTFAPDYESDPVQMNLGREIIKRCRGIPLAIQALCSLLTQRNTIQEWEAIERGGLQEIYNSTNDATLSILKLSYDDLPSQLKHCFAYCSLFPKDYKYMKHELTCHWISQGYITPDNEENSFNDLLRRRFFKDVEIDEFGKIQSFKMHALMHDLALREAGGESIALSGTGTASQNPRHVYVEDYERDTPPHNSSGY